jgi:hypothetical protein
MYYLGRFFRGFCPVATQAGLEPFRHAFNRASYSILFGCITTFAPLEKPKISQLSAFPALQDIAQYGRPSVFTVLSHMKNCFLSAGLPILIVCRNAEHFSG